jgi:hypothetical protein
MKKEREMRIAENQTIGVAVLLVIISFLSACASAPAPKIAPVQPAPCVEKPVAVTPAPAPAPVAVEPAPAVQPAPEPEPRPASISAEALGLYRSPMEARKPPTDDELLVIDSAKILIGEAPNAKVVVKGKQFTLDCIGTVSAIFYRLDIDVTKDFGKYSGNGVNRLYMTLKDHGVLHRDKYPRTGDVIVWDNTWDANDDGDRTDDPRTHAGVVLAVDEDGTIHYIHENMFKGVIIEMMNLLRPTVASDENGKRLNSGLAIATKSGGPKPEHWLSGDVFNAFGDLLRIKNDLKVAAAGGGEDDLCLARQSTVAFP